MKIRILILTVMFAISVACLAKADGSWLKKVPESARTRVNPYAGQPQAAAAGEILFENNCARCHGEHADGKLSRPSLKSERVQHASDGELAWLLKNGNVFKGMPTWGALPEQERWQIITYIRSLSPVSTEVQQ
ncbi:MAG: cytochrome c [Acidobacteriaceae bacterium]